MEKGQAACGLPLFKYMKNVKSGFFVVILTLGFDLDFILAIRRFFEIADTLAQRPADLRQSAGTKHNQNNNQYDDQFGHTKSKHYILLCIPVIELLYLRS